MHNLEQSIAAWRKTMAAGAEVAPETLDELESHLRDTVEQLVGSGVAQDEAFRRAVAELGSSSAMASEFQKLKPPMWLPVKLVVESVITVALALAVFLLSGCFFFNALLWHLHEGVSGKLLAAHVFAVTLGYTTTLLLGILGICFVSQRCLFDFSPSRLSSLSRFCGTFGRVAAGFTALGIVLGMVWSRRESGQFWSWDPKEIGALSVLVWQIGFLVAHRSRRVSARGLLVGSILGGNVVSLTWFGPLVLALGVHSYGRPSPVPLVAVISIFSLFFFLGLAPAGWLRLRKV